MRTVRSDRSGDPSRWLVQLERESDLDGASGLEAEITS
jgi:hypothetical protein